MQEATTGDDAHKRQKKQEAVMVFRQRKAIGDSNAHLLKGVRLVKTHHDKVQRILKAHRAFKKKVKRYIRAGIPPSDWNLAELVDDDDDNSDDELEQGVVFGRWRIPSTSHHPAVGTQT